MQSSLLFPIAVAQANDGLGFGGASNGGADPSTPGNPKTPTLGDWGSSSFKRRATPEIDAAGAAGSSLYQTPRTAGRTPSRPISLLLHDIVTPESHPRGEYHSSRKPGHSTPWSRSNSGPAAPPPPPIETLGDFIDRTPEAATPPLQASSSGPRIYGSPVRGEGLYGSPPARGAFPGSYGSTGAWDALIRSTPAGPPTSWEGAPLSPGGAVTAGGHTPWKSLSFREGAVSPEMSPMADSPVSGVVHSAGMLTLAPPQSLGLMQQPGTSAEDERWVTVYGFTSDDTNLVLREFERCGPITEHVFGPRGANWMHLRYENKYDARKALAKNSAQLTGSLIIGVKPVDPQLRSSIVARADDSKRAQQIGSPLSKTVFGPGPRTPAPAYRPYLLQTGDGASKAPRIAQPNRSTLTKVLDFLFSA